ncbi:radial spoke head 10 protein [Acrasis kona]|uniref:Radial spoke head 10 protein n=1 Tax=Acrasis kona TaxID=1008807 RepID=A0AAW2ZDC1_9EUKA
MNNFNTFLRQVVNPLLHSSEQSVSDDHRSLEYKRIYTKDAKQTLLYEGQTLPGSEIKNGEGKLYNTDNGNISYEGQFSNNKRNGFGILYDTINLGRRIIYEGEWRDDLKHGQGLYYELVGSKVIWTYDGQWQNDLRHGYGFFSGFEGIDIYEGEWRNGVRHGPGLSEDGINQQQFYCTFHADEKHGKTIVYNLIDKTQREVHYNNGVKMDDEPVQNLGTLIGNIELQDSDAINGAAQDITAAKTQEKITISAQLEVINRQTKTIQTLEAKLQIITQQEKKLKETLEEKTMCAICMENTKNCALSPCGHVLCDTCAETQSKCPFCFKSIQHKLVLYM